MEKNYYYDDGINPSSYDREAGAAIDTGVVGEKNDVFGEEEGHDIKYKTMTWQMVAVLMIAEIVSNGMLSLPSSSGVVGVCIVESSCHDKGYRVLILRSLYPTSF